MCQVYVNKQLAVSHVNARDLHASSKVSDVAQFRVSSTFELVEDEAACLSLLDFLVPSLCVLVIRMICTL